MSNEAYYNYYISDEATADRMWKRHQKEVQSKRTESLEKLLKDTGAQFYAESSSWGRPSYVSGVAFKMPFDVPNHMKVIRHSHVDGERCVMVRGKMNSKAGKQFQALIDSTNAELKDLPKFTDWVVEQLDLMATGIGGPHESGRGFAMLSTSGGMLGKVLGFAIPNEKCEEGKAPVVPDDLEQITYGQWYDMINDQ